MPYKIGDTFFAVDLDVNIYDGMILQPIHKHTVKHIKKQGRKQIYCAFDHYLVGWFEESNMFPTLEDAKKFYYKHIDKEFAALEEEYTEKWNKLCAKKCFIFNYQPPDNSIDPLKKKARTNALRILFQTGACNNASKS